jgi:hypothetical protein
MLGKHSGVVCRLKQKYRNRFTWHCLNHRLELLVSDAIKDVVCEIDHFKAFMDKLYSLYSQSPKHSRALKIACHDVGLQFVKVERVLGMLWVSGSFKTVKTVWTSLGALYSHFTNSLEDTTIDANLKVTIYWFAKKSWKPRILSGPRVDVRYPPIAFHVFQSTSNTTDKAVKSRKPYKKDNAGYRVLKMSQVKKLSWPWKLKNCLYQQVPLVSSMKIVSTNKNSSF